MTTEWLVLTLRKVTHTVKVAPFVIAVFYMITILGYMYMPDFIIDILDLLLYISPLSIALLLILSRHLHLCIWHKLECLLPAVCMVPGLFDTLFVSLSEIATYINAILLSFVLLISLVNAYFVFVKPTVKR